MTMTPERLAELDAVMATVTAAFPITSRDTADYAEITFGSSQTQAMSMEPATLLAINDVFAAIPDLRAHIDAQAAQIDALQAFKDYVHERLDAAGIPTHPDGRHSVAGCRVGDRLDIALDAQAATIARQDEALNIAHTAFADCDQSNPMQVEAIAIVRAALTGAAS